MELRQQIRELVSDFRSLVDEVPGLRLNWLVLDGKPFFSYGFKLDSPPEHGRPAAIERVHLLAKRAGTLLARCELPKTWQGVLVEKEPAERWLQFVLLTCSHLSGKNETELPPAIPELEPRGKRQKTGLWKPPAPLPPNSARGTFYNAAKIMALAAEHLLDICPTEQLKQENVDEQITGPELARRYNVDANLLRKRLEYFRKNNRGSKDWNEIETCSSNEAKYLYRLGAVIDIVRRLKIKT